MSEGVPPGAAVFTPNQMFNMIQAVGTKVDHLASILDPALMTVRQELVEVRKEVGDHENRLRNHEKRLWIMAVVATASGAGISQLLPLIGGS